MFIRLSTFLTVAILLSSVGCKSTSLLNRNLLKPFAEDDIPEFAEPRRMAVIWKDSVLQRTGSEPTRGFGGRIYFYDAENKAIKADGELVIYGFEGDSTKGNAAADHKYVFRQPDFQKHFDATGIGDSYSIWIPWEKIGGHRKQITLIPMFKPKAGRLIQSDASIVVLPGKDPSEGQLQQTKITQRSYGYPDTTKQSHAASPDSSYVVQASGTESHSPRQEQTDDSLKKNRLRTTTITLPRDFGNRLATLPSQTIPLAKEVKNPVSNTPINQVKFEKHTKRPEIDPKINFQAGLHRSKLTKSFSPKTEEKQRTLTLKSPVFGVPDSYR